MVQHNQSDKNRFIYHRNGYYGQFQLPNLVFNANLQEFAQKVGYISALETNGKLDPENAYKQIQALWKQLKQSKKELLIEKEPPGSV
ncbi:MULTISPECIES: hypothetical protein [unclassified Nostoc]|uniref:DUF7219 family protein n=1 Tax=unclassified Nostoc TaxID=2593658 RepID=UPI002AD57C96|nr:hypothetical protein [Nostoc sp. DedQUE03]MDZ7975105.1 hypothetical protein [Nostoc sp. DedQUE03]MDZ8045714.1 hypothetical protein [Nostoc sp. DedQUE02]